MSSFTSSTPSSLPTSPSPQYTNVPTLRLASTTCTSFNNTPATLSSSSSSSASTLSSSVDYVIMTLTFPHILGPDLSTSNAGSISGEFIIASVSHTTVKNMNGEDSAITKGKLKAYYKEICGSDLREMEIETPEDMAVAGTICLTALRGEGWVYRCGIANVQNEN